MFALEETFTKCYFDHSDNLPNEVMLWDEQEAKEKEIAQVGVSACGATAVIFYPILPSARTHSK